MIVLRRIASLCLAAILTVPAGLSVAGPGTVHRFSTARCDALKGRPIDDGLAEITGAKVVPAAPPAPQYCLVTADFNDSSLKFNVWLPMENWNGKLAYLGGGGFDGIILQPSFGAFGSKALFDEHYAIVMSNGGYDAMSQDDLQHGRVDQAKYFRAEFAYDAKKLADFTFQSVHRTLPRGKDVIRAFYGSDPKKSYFQGCSMGGHEAMMESQRYPKDFDGIVAGAPAGNIVGLMTQFNRIATAVRSSAGLLSPAQRSLLAKAVLAECDALDGLADGVISNPRACRFEASSLRCAAGTVAGDSCLSDAQIDTVKRITTAFATSDGKIFHSGFNFGGEDLDKGWGEYIWPQDKSGGASTQAHFSDGFVRSFITRDPKFDTSHWNPNDWLPELDLINAMFEAFDPDLSGMLAHGAKLVMWNGALDTSVSARDSGRYYDQVVATLGQKKADTALELFIEPGVGHCGGGPGPDQLDWFKVMTDWVEKGVAPSRQNLVLTKNEAPGKAKLQRPLCKYPSYPAYRGKGDTNDASSFDCAAPDPSE
jgi:hypothetical protein